MKNLNMSAVYVVFAVWVLGLCVGGFFGYNDGKKAGRQSVMLQFNCPHCNHQIPVELR